MAAGAGELQSDLIDAVCQRIHERLPEEQARPCESFVRQYYRWVPDDDLEERSPLDLYGAAVAHWNLLQHRSPGEAKVHVYNPVFDRNGWQSPHTAVEIVTDDMPFLVDSVSMQLGHGGHEIKLVIHPVIRVRRDTDGNLVDVLPHGVETEDAIAESVLHVEVEREVDLRLLGYIRVAVERVLAEVRATVEDWSRMRELAGELADELATLPDEDGERELAETGAFLRWLADDHFTFLGYREYEVDRSSEQVGLQSVPGSGLGILRGTSQFKPLADRTVALLDSPRVLVLTKANSRSTVHRPAYLDYVGVKRVDSSGRVIGEYRFLGLYTHDAYNEPARDIPILRGKLRYVLDRGGFPPHGHDEKALTEIVESYPRDSLFQIAREDLFDVAIGIVGLGERQLVRLFVRGDPLERYVACLVCIPRDRFNTDNRERTAGILVDAFSGTHVDWTLLLSESLNVRVHYIVHGGRLEGVDIAEVQARVVNATRAWSDDLHDAVVEALGEERGGAVHRRYDQAFPPAYRDDWEARSAVADIARIEELQQGAGPIISLYRPLESPDGTLRCKLFSASGISLSDVLPTFEHMGARVIDERPYEITPADRQAVWIYNFGLHCPTQDLDAVHDRFQEAFLAVWSGELEDDGLNGLVLNAGLDSRQVTVIRAITKYLRQAGIPFSDSYMERTLIAHPGIVELIVQLFRARLDPDARDLDQAEQLAQQIGAAIDAVQSLDEDRILRAFLSVVRATLRTNHYCHDANGARRPYLSMKLDPGEIPLLPEPRPRFEIFVYSPRVEGVHLRGGSVARGGLRWSDRREDFRTEILGLMKAQMVKNALIVPVGSKGGFVVKQPPAQGGREAQLAEGIAC